MPGMPAIAVDAWSGSLGLEPTIEMFVAHIVTTFREVRRVLKDDGTLFLNLGDSYFGGGGSFGPIRPGWRALPCDKNDKELPNYQGDDYLSIHLCDGCQDAFANDIRCIDSRLFLVSTAYVDDPTQGHNRRDDSCLESLDSAIRLQIEQSNHATLDPMQIEDPLNGQLLSFRASMIEQSWPPPPGECWHCANCGACLSVLRSSSRDARECAHNSAYNDGKARPVFSSVPRIAGINHSVYPYGDSTIAYRDSQLKPKDLVGMPWRIAFALQADGWYLRSDIIWAKPNPMPESVTDRPTKAHEYIFLMSKSAKYWYDAEAIKEPSKYPNGPNSPESIASPYGQGFTRNAKNHPEESRSSASQRMGRAPGWRKRDKQRGHGRRHAGFNDRWDHMTKEEQCDLGRNKRTVWTVATQPFTQWTRTDRLYRVAQGELCDGMKHIVFPNCPAHGGLSGPLAIHAYDERATDVLIDICRIDICLVRELLLGFSPTAPSRVSESVRSSWDYLAQRCAQIAKDHSNETSKRGLSPETIRPYISFAQIADDIDDKLIQLVWFVLCARIHENSILQDGSDVHLLGKMIVDTVGKSFSFDYSCCCQLYKIETQETSHFAVYPEKLITPCVLAGCRPGGVILDPFMGAGTTAVVAADYGRDYIGFELSAEYITIAEKRIYDRTRQTVLL